MLATLFWFLPRWPWRLFPGPDPGYLDDISLVVVPGYLGNISLVVVPGYLGDASVQDERDARVAVEQHDEGQQELNHDRDEPVRLQKPAAWNHLTGESVATPIVQLLNPMNRPGTHAQTRKQNVFPWVFRKDLPQHKCSQQCHSRFIRLSKTLLDAWLLGSRITHLSGGVVGEIVDDARLALDATRRRVVGDVVHEPDQPRRHQRRDHVSLACEGRRSHVCSLLQVKMTMRDMRRTPSWRSPLESESWRWGSGLASPKEPVFQFKINFLNMTHSVCISEGRYYSLGDPEPRSFGSLRTVPSRNRLHKYSVLTNMNLVPDGVHHFCVPLHAEKHNVVGGADHETPLPQVRLPQPTHTPREKNVVSCVFKPLEVRSISELNQDQSCTGHASLTSLTAVSLSFPTNSHTLNTNLSTEFLRETTFPTHQKQAESNTSKKHQWEVQVTSKYRTQNLDVERKQSAHPCTTDETNFFVFGAVTCAVTCDCMSIGLKNKCAVPQWNWRTPWAVPQLPDRWCIQPFVHWINLHWSIAND